MNSFQAISALWIHVIRSWHCASVKCIVTVIPVKFVEGCLTSCQVYFHILSWVLFVQVHDIVSTSLNIARMLLGKKITKKQNIFNKLGRFPYNINCIKIISYNKTRLVQGLLWGHICYLEGEKLYGLCKIYSKLSCQAIELFWGILTAKFASWRASPAKK
jgi:hypothetical protein